MINIIKLFIKILSFISLFDRELTMSVTPWSSGNCTITDSSKYAAFIITVNSYPIIAIRDGDLISGFSVTASASLENIRSFSARTNGDIWTLSYSYSLRHTASGSHNAMEDSTTYSISKVVGLVPSAILS